MRILVTCGVDNAQTGTWAVRHQLDEKRANRFCGRWRAGNWLFGGTVGLVENTAGDNIQQSEDLVNRVPCMYPVSASGCAVRSTNPAVSQDLPTVAKNKRARDW